MSFLGALLYVLSAIALPSLHVGFHRDDHEHRGGGLKLLHGTLGAHQDLPAHSHRASLSREVDDDLPAGLPDSDASVVAPASFSNVAILAALQPRSPLSRASSLTCALQVERLTAGSGHPPARDPTHGDGSLVHFASAFLPSASPATTPLAGPQLARARFFPPADRAPHSPCAATKAARGPPFLVAT